MGKNQKWRGKVFYFLYSHIIHENLGVDSDHNFSVNLDVDILLIPKLISKKCKKFLVKLYR